MTVRELRCKDLVAGQWAIVLKDLRKILATEDQPEDGDTILSYGYGFDYVPAFTFEKQKEGYFRWTLSGGGPSSEIRFFAQASPRGWKLVRAEYWYMDWGDGAKRNVKAGPAFQVLESIWDDTFENQAQAEYERASE